MKDLVKVSGDLTREERFYEWLSSISSSLDKLFILCGGGSSITRILDKNNIPYKFGPHGREIYSLRGKWLARQVLKEEKSFVEHRLKDLSINATVFIPVKWLIFHINGDDYVLDLYPKFGKIYVVTLKGRKKPFLENLDKIEVVYL